MMDQGATNLRWAETLISALVGAGVRHAVLSPGSRSTPLTLACERQPQLQTWVQVDERSAAFFALGLALEKRQPVALVCTSGSAPGHWLPAVIEANHALVPLLLLSADRPPELQDCGANQTIDQVRLFGSQVRAFHQLPPAEGTPESLHRLSNLARNAVAQSLGPLPGPVHINLPFREPLLPAQALPPPPAPVAIEPTEAPPPTPDPVQLVQLRERLSGRGLIICGPGRFDSRFAPAVTRLAAALNAPLLADPLSGLRFGGHDQALLSSRYDAYLRDPAFCAAHRPDWVLRFGAMPVSKSLHEYLRQHPPRELFLVAPHGRRLDPLHITTETLYADPSALCHALLESELPPSPAAWADEFRAAEQRARELDSEQCLESGIVHTLLAHLPAQSLLFCGNSMAIRDLDSFSGSAAKPLQLLANRGASGIDGNVSTVLGLAAAYRGPGTVVGLLGDLAFYHDMNGLLAARGLDATFIILNNDGGGIFYHLPQAGLEQFERAWRTPTGLDFEQAARLYRLPFQRVDSVEGFAAALPETLARPGVKLLEFSLDPAVSHAGHQAYWEALGSQPA